MIPVLICGGYGKKMWPLSRQKFPKHFLPLFNDQSLFQINYQALRLRFKPQEIFVQTIPEQARIAHKQCPDIPLKNLFIEPEMRDQGPATCFIAAKLFKLSPDEPFTVVQADDLRQPQENYLKMIDQFDKLVKSDHKLMTGGFRPDHAIMGIDYLRTKEKFQKVQGIKIYVMDEWLGRDTDEEVIEKYLKEELVLAHTNHYTWTPRLMLDACRKWAPDWYEHLEKIIKAFGTKSESTTVRREYSQMEKAGIERITQHSLKDGYVVELPFKWDDFGTWESVGRYKTENSMYQPDDLLTIDSPGCFVQKDKGKFLAIIGLENIVVIDTKDGLLVCNRNQTGRVGEVVIYLREKGKKEYL